MKIYLGLVHYPITNKVGEKVHTSVTNLDIHDIARSCRTFGVKNYFIVTPIMPQQDLVNSILGHWKEDQANQYNPDRQEALSFTQVKSTVADAINQIREIEGEAPLVVCTGANFQKASGDTEVLTKRLSETNIPCLLLFGTGWGLHSEIVETCDFKLAPISSRKESGYNHLSVRSAVAIYLDRLLGNNATF